MALPTQGVMLSERPLGSLGCGSRATTDGAGGGGSPPLAGAGSIGNYKGVMLCNRPFAGSAAAAKGGSGDGAAAAGKNVFVTGKVKSEVGFAGKHMQTEKLLRKRVKQETALTRHRRWLADLQLTKEALEEKYMEDLQRKEESRRRFAKREARMRQVTRELAHACGGVTEHDGDDCRHDELTAKPHYDGDMVHKNKELGSHAWDIGLDDDEHASGMSSNSAPPPGEKGHDDRNLDTGEEDGVSSRVDSAELRVAEKRRKRDGKPCRPMWSMTAAKAEAEAERKHEGELEDLLEFTRCLDFDKYIRDAEVQAMINQVKRRIAEIEAQPEVDGVDDDDMEHSDWRGRLRLHDVEARLEAKITRLTDKSLRERAGIDCVDSDGSALGGGHASQQEDNISIARTALSEGGRSVRSVHSTRSLTAVAERSRVAIVATDDTNQGGERTADVDGRDSGPSRTEGPVNDIVVVTHQSDGGLRRGGKNTVSNLPYIRRNPAV